MFRHYFESSNKDTPTTKTAKDYLNQKNEKETGKDRLCLMFSLDEEGSISNELNSIYQASIFGLLTGICYGGFIQSRLAYLNFMENNQATAFTSHFEAKKKLQEQVTINFAKGAFRWGWRLALFTTSYVGLTTAISVYRNKSSIIEYATAGGLSGAIYKMNLGVRGLAVGGLVGSVFGSVAGCCSLLILHMSGKSMQEIRYWQYKWKEDRERVIAEAIKAQSQEQDDELMINHNEIIGKGNIDLDNLPSIEIETKKK